MPALDAAFLQTVSPALDATYSAFEGEARGSNKELIELCLDADRMTTLGNSPDADALVSEAIKEHGYAKVLAYLHKNVKL